MATNIEARGKVVDLDEDGDACVVLVEIPRPAWKALQRNDEVRIVNVTAAPTFIAGLLDGLKNLHDSTCLQRSALVAAGAAAPPCTCGVATRIEKLHVAIVDALAAEVAR